MEQNCLFAICTYFLCYEIKYWLELNTLVCLVWNIGSCKCSYARLHNDDEFNLPNPIAAWTIYVSGILDPENSGFLSKWRGDYLCKYIPNLGKYLLLFATCTIEIKFRKKNLLITYTFCFGVVRQHMNCFKALP